MTADRNMGESRGGEGRSERDDQYFLGGFLASLVHESEATAEQILIRSLDGHSYAVQIYRYGEKWPEALMVTVDYEAFLGAQPAERSPDELEGE